jgi:hypothetical protein
MRTVIMAGASLLALWAFSCGGQTDNLESDAVSTTVEALTVSNEPIKRTKGPYMAPSGNRNGMYAYRVNSTSLSGGAVGDIKLCGVSAGTCTNYGQPAGGTKSGPAWVYPNPPWYASSGVLAVLGTYNSKATIWARGGSSSWAYNNWYNPNTTSYGFTPNSAPALATDPSDRSMTMAILDTNGQVWYRTKWQTGENAWTKAPAKKMKAAPGVFYDRSGDIFLVGVDASNNKAYFTTCGYPTCFTGWNELPGTNTWSSGVSGGSRVDNTGTLYYEFAGVRNVTTGTDNNIGRVTLDANFKLLRDDTFASTAKTQTTPTVGLQNTASPTYGIIVVVGTDGKYYTNTTTASTTTAFGLAASM